MGSDAPEQGQFQGCRFDRREGRGKCHHDRRKFRWRAGGRLAAGRWHTVAWRPTRQNKASFKDVNLNGAKVTGDIDMNGASFEGELNAYS